MTTLFEHRQLDRNARFPPGLRVWAHEHHDASVLTMARRRAFDMARIKADIPVPPALVAANSAGVETVWLFADPAFSLYGQEVPPQVLAVESRLIEAGSKGILKVPDPTDYNRLIDTFIERLLPEDIEKWKLAKAGGLNPANQTAPKTTGPC